MVNDAPSIVLSRKLREVIAPVAVRIECYNISPEIYILTLIT